MPGWPRRARPRAALCGAALVLIYPCLATGHVELESPIGGESLQGGSVYTIEWIVAIEHATLDWDLWYSTTSRDGPWIDIAQDLPAGDTSQFSLHTYDWSVPDVDAPAAWVRVRQDNADNDYESRSAESFGISAPAGAAGDYNGDQRVDAADYAVWRDTLGTESAGADGDNNGVVDPADYDVWRGAYLGAPDAPLPAPEPGTLAMLAGASLACPAARRARSRRRV